MTESQETKPSETSKTDKNFLNSPSNSIALGLLVICFLAFGAGLLKTSNALNKESLKQPTETSSKVMSKLLKKDHILQINLSGPIFMDAPQQQGGFLDSDTNAMAARKALDEAADDDHVKGVLIRINSPGGTVGMSQELNKAVNRVRKAGKPVVASLGDITASGGYYTAVAADKIIANEGTLVGSIGVIISNLNMTDLFTQKLGIQPLTVKSGKYKDMLSPYRKPRPDEIALLQSIIDESYQDFLGAVVEGRTKFIADADEKKKVAARIASVADGRVMHGHSAIENHLVDEVGDYDYAYDVIDQMAKEKFNLKGDDRLPIQKYSQSTSLLDALGLSLKVPDNIVPKLGVENPLESHMPFSYRYPNQPLWVME